MVNFLFIKWNLIQNKILKITTCRRRRANENSKRTKKHRLEEIEEQRKILKEYKRQLMEEKQQEFSRMSAERKTCFT